MARADVDIDSASEAVVLTKSDATLYDGLGTNRMPWRALYISGAGAVKVKMVSGDDCLFAAVPAGTLLPIRVTMVYSTDTTATGIVGLR